MAITELVRKVTGAREPRYMELEGQPVDFTENPPEEKVEILEDLSEEQKGRLYYNKAEFDRNHRVKLERISRSMSGRPEALSAEHVLFIDNLLSDWAMIDERIAVIRAKVEALLARKAELLRQRELNEAKIGHCNAQIVRYEGEIREYSIRAERIRRAEAETPKRGLLRAQQSLAVDELARTREDIERRDLPAQISQFRHKDIPSATVNLEEIEVKVSAIDYDLRAESRDLDAVFDACRQLSGLEAEHRAKLLVDLGAYAFAAIDFMNHTSGPGGHLAVDGRHQISSQPMREMQIEQGSVGAVPEAYDSVYYDQEGVSTAQEPEDATVATVVQQPQTVQKVSAISFIPRDSEN